jgi:undecaprenyl-diphosphatase
MLDAVLAWDERMFRLLNGSWLTPTLDVVLPFVTDARHYTLLFVIAAIILVVLGRLDGFRFLILAVVSVMVADAISSYIIKHVIIRPRPCITLEGVRLLVGCTDSPSFPSNHAVNATVLATLVTLYMPRLWFPAIALAILVGYSRVYVGVHYPLDVLLGGLLGLVVALVLSWILTILWPFPSGLDHQHRTFSLTFRDREGRMD